MTLHHRCAILRGFFSGDFSYVMQVMPLRRTGYCRELSLNVVTFRVKNPALSFLYCTPR